MQNRLYDYACEEMEELEKKVAKGQKLSAAEMQYADLLAHFKKSMLTSHAMEESEYSNDGYSRTYSNFGNSYARRRRDSMGRYSRDGYSMDGEEMVAKLQEMMQDAPDEMTRKEFQRFITKIQNM